MKVEFVHCWCSVVSGTVIPLMFLDTLTIDPHAPLADRATLAGMAVVHPQQPYGAVTLPRTLLCSHVVVLLSQKIKCDFFSARLKTSANSLSFLFAAQCVSICASVRGF